MDFYSADVSNMRFNKVVRSHTESFNMSTKMIQLLLALDGRKSMAQVARQMNAQVYELRETLAHLWELGLIRLVDEGGGKATNLIERQLILLLKINLTYLTQQKQKTESFVSRTLADMGLTEDKIPVNRMEELLDLLAPVISDSRKRTTFLEYMKSFIPENQPSVEKSTGNIKHIISAIISQRSKGNPVIAQTLKTKLMLKGVNPDRYSEETPDDPVMLKKLTMLARNMGVDISSEKSSDDQDIGNMKRIIDAIILQRSRGNFTIAQSLKTKLMLKGINPDKYSEETPDDPAMLEKLTMLARNMGVDISLEKSSDDQDTGSIKRVIDAIISQRSNGNPAIAKNLKAKFMLKGINPDNYTENTPDDKDMLEKLMGLANSLNIIL